MIKIYVSDKCPDCTKWLDRQGELPPDVEWINITDSMKNLKEFLKLRDTKEKFYAIRQEHTVGIPMVVKDGEILFPERIEEIFPNW